MIVSIVLTLGVIALNALPVARAPMILAVNADDRNAEKAVAAAVEAYDKHYRVKSRNMTANSLDLIVELRTARGAELVGEVMALEGITSASLLSHDGEVTF